MKMLKGRFLLICLFVIFCALLYGYHHILNENEEQLSRYAFMQDGSGHSEPGLHTDSYPTRPALAQAEDRLGDSSKFDIKYKKLDTKIQPHQLSSGNRESDIFKSPESSSVDAPKLVPLVPHMGEELSDMVIDDGEGRSNRWQPPVQLKKGITRTSSVLKKTYSARATVSKNEALLQSKRQQQVGRTHLAPDESMHIKERRRQANTKRKQIEDKVWFELDVAEIMKGVKEGGVVEVQKKPDIGLPQQIDPSHWEGLNSSLVYEHYPDDGEAHNLVAWHPEEGVVLLTDYVLDRPFFAPNDSSAAGMQGSPDTIDDLTDGQAEDRFYQLISTAHVDCRLIQRMGSVNDGGWDLCTVPPYNFKSGCLVYSFGINYDFVFDDAMATAFNCSVKSFDPSMTVSDYIRSANVLFYQLGLGAKNTVTEKGWKLMSLRSLRSKLGHSEKVIDVIKIDIDYSEWECLREMATDGSLNRVKQLIFEIHTAEVETVQRPSSKLDFVDMYESLVLLERAGFRRYNHHYNTLGQYTSVRTGKTRSCCYELYYINIRFLKQR